MTATIAITLGEPAGIGPELCAKIAEQDWPAKLVFVGDRTLLGPAAAGFPPFDPQRDNADRTCLDLPLRVPTRAGALDPANAGYVVETLTRAITGCVNGSFDAMVTAPVHKGVINDAGIEFTGHTELLAQQTNSREVLMLLAAGNLRVALATTHLPLRRVADQITSELIRQRTRLLASELRRKFGIAEPRILVCGLNPHAGEGGHLGREDDDLIRPAVELLQTEGLSVIGPLPADTVFTQHWLARADAVLAMYHDQGLPVLKYAGFGQAVNVTLGLPIIRTSVDHGTALDIAGSGEADDGSLRAALALAIELAGNIG